ncbi:MAG: CBS domain-containing protein [Myxococcales bacterium]|nr:CBS domain-containing protein [Myxococcales bacterium]
MIKKVERAVDMMTHPAFCLSPSTSINIAAKTLVDRHIHGAPVIADNGALVGLISDEDLLRVQASAAFHAMPAGDVATHMTRDPLTVEIHTDIFEITRLFQDKGASRLPVMDEGACVGIITRRNLLEALQRLAKFKDNTPRSAFDLYAKLRRTS